jgi:hypothetical protein
MPHSSVSVLDLSKNKYGCHAPAAYGLRPRFLSACHQLTELSWTFDHFDFIPTELLPTTLKRLKLFITRVPRVSQLPNRISFTQHVDTLSQLDLFEIHCDWATITAEYTGWLFNNMPVSISFTLVIYGLEAACQDQTFSIEYRGVLANLRNRMVHLNPVRFKAALNFEEMDEWDWAYMKLHFARIKEHCGNMPMDCLPTYFQGFTRSAMACQIDLLALGDRRPNR